MARFSSRPTIEQVYSPFEALGVVDSGLVLDLTGRAVRTGTISSHMDISVTGQSDSNTQPLTVLFTATDDYNLTFDSDWVWAGTKPTTISSGVQGMLSVMSIGDAGTDVVAAYKVLGDGS